MHYENSYELIPFVPFQEERRRSGNQSAQYTGIWGLGPWITDMAREPEDAEPFSFRK